jgi:hypothetical protein
MAERGAAEVTGDGWAEHFALCPGISDVYLFRYRERVVDLDAEVPDRALDLRVTEQELDGPQVASAPIYQAHLGASKRVGAVDARIEADACDPLRYEPSVLACRHALIDRAAACEQKIARLLACGPEIVIDRLQDEPRCRKRVAIKTDPGTGG